MAEILKKGKAIWLEILKKYKAIIENQKNKKHMDVKNLPDTLKRSLSSPGSFFLRCYKKELNFPAFSYIIIV